MFKKTIFFLSLFALLHACTNEPADQQATDAEPAAQTPPPNNFEELKARAIDESDHLGRVRATLAKVQKEYDQTKGQLPGRGNVTTSIDDQFTLSIRNELGGDVLETKVGLKNLNPENGGMMLLPDNQPGERPGLRILVLEGKPGVSFFKNGKLEKEERHLDIYMPQRHHIENLAPVLSSILNVAHGKGE